MAALVNTAVLFITGITGRSSSCLYTLQVVAINVLDSLDDDLDLETEAGDTQFTADTESREALATLVGGNTWMIYRNVITNVLHWDFVRIPLEAQFRS